MKKLSLIAALLCLSALLIVPAAALEYDIDAPSGPEFGKPTSVEPVVTADQGELPNVDASKNAALIPPSSSQAPYLSLPANAESSFTSLLLLSPQSLTDGFVGSPWQPSAHALGTGTPLTPNLAPGYMVSEGRVSGSAGIIIVPPTQGIGTAVTIASGFTATTADLCYSNGSLGTLSIPRLGVNVSIFEGTDSATLAKGAGHFVGTSIWSGNSCFAAHNRGVNAYFGQIHTLNAGDTITLTTKLGTRTYAVTSVEKVLETDLSGLSATARNQITLYTCVRDQPVYRWCVKGVEIM